MAGVKGRSGGRRKGAGRKAKVVEIELSKLLDAKWPLEEREAVSVFAARAAQGDLSAFQLARWLHCEWSDGRVQGADLRRAHLRTHSGLARWFHGVPRSDCTHRKYVHLAASPRWLFSSCAAELAWGSDN